MKRAICLVGILFLALVFAGRSGADAGVLELLMDAEPMPFAEPNDVPLDGSGPVAVRHTPDPADISWWLLTPPDSWVDRGSHKEDSDGSRTNQVSDTTQWPYRTVCKLYMRYGWDWSECSGAFMVDNHLVFTAGHCLYDYYSSAWADEVIVVPAKNGSYEPYGSKAGYNWYVGGGWYNYGSSNDDWGVVEVDAFSTGWMGNRVESTGWYTGKTFHTAGYPAAYGYPGDRMWYDSGTCMDESDYRIWVNFDFKASCIPGQSGSAIWYKSGASRWIVANLTTSDCGGTKLRDDIVEWMESIYVEIEDFEVSLTGGAARVRWKTSYEDSIAGWNIYRSVDGGDYERINGAIIAPYQYDYEFTDTDISPSHSYCYRLEAVNLAGGPQTFGIECADVPDTGGGTALFETDTGADDTEIDAAGGCGHW